MPRTVVTVAQNGSTMRRRPNPPKAVTAQARKMRGGGNPRSTAPENNRPRAVSPERLGGSKQEHFAVMICGDVTEFIHTACETFAPEDQQAEDNDSIIDKEAKDAPPQKRCWDERRRLIKCIWIFKSDLSFQTWYIGEAQPFECITRN